VIVKKKATCDNEIYARGRNMGSLIFAFPTIFTSVHVPTGQVTYSDEVRFIRGSVILVERRHKIEQISTFCESQSFANLISISWPML
jgi:hypothetical protein